MEILTANIMSHLWVAQAAESELRANKGSFITSSSVAGLMTGGSSMVSCVCADLNERANTRPIVSSLPPQNIHDRQALQFRRETCFYQPVVLVLADTSRVEGWSPPPH